VQTGASIHRSFVGTSTGAPAASEIDLATRVAEFTFTLAARAAEFKERADAARRAERAAALPRVSPSYFDPGHYSLEEEWWSKQLGSK